MLKYFIALLLLRQIGKVMNELGKDLAFMRGQKFTNSVDRLFVWLCKASGVICLLGIALLAFTPVASLLLFLAIVLGAIAALVSIWRMYLEAKYELKAVNLGPGDHGMCSGRTIGLGVDCNHGASYMAGGGGEHTLLCLCCCAKWEQVHAASDLSKTAGIAIGQSSMPLHDGRCFDFPESNIAILDD